MSSRGHGQAAGREQSSILGQIYPGSVDQVTLKRSRYLDRSCPNWMVGRAVLLHWRTISWWSWPLVQKLSLLINRYAK